jgi:beta-carotene hydroxylase
MQQLFDQTDSMDVVREAPDVYVPAEKPKPQKWLKCPQRADEIRALCRPDGAKHLLYGTLPHFSIYGLAIYLQLTVNAPWANLLLSVLLGWQLYVLFVLHHDCMHGSAFREDFLNRLMGRLYALTFTMTFSVNRQTHMRHHAYISDPERDPDEYYFSGELWQIGPRIWRYYEWYTRIALTRYGKRVRDTVLVEQGINFALWAVIHVVLFQMGLGIKVLYIFWLPMVVVAFIINPITRGYEHAPITLYPKEDPRRRDMSRNSITVANPWLGWLCANITYHVEHHAYPRCPFFNLQKLHRIFQEEKMQYLVAPYPLYRVWKGKRMIEGMTCNALPHQESALPEFGVGEPR